MSDTVYAIEPDVVSVVDGFIPVQGPPGGGTRIQGELDDVSELPDGAEVGDAWVIDGDIWVWTETETWFNAGPYVGPAGPQGIQGEPGPAGSTGPAGEQGIQGVQGDPGATGPTGDTGPQGIQGNPGTSTRIVGEVATVGALPAASSVSVGDSYIVTADGNLYTSTGTAWLDVGQIVGPQGPTGSTGATGATGSQGIQGVQGIQGIQGDPGPTGPQGDPGEPGGSLLTAFWTYASTTTAPPSSGQARTNSPITTLWLSETDTDGMLRSAGLATAEAGDTIIVRAANGTAMDLLITGTPVDSGTYYTIPVSVTTGTVTKGARTQFGILSPTPHGLPAGGSTGQLLTKSSGTDYAVGWTTEAWVNTSGDTMTGALDMGMHLIHNVDVPVDDEDAANKIYVDELFNRSLNAQTGTTYTPVVGDEKLMVTLSNASAITVTLPQNSAAAFPVGAEVDFLWLGVGQPTFTNGTGATVNGTPGLKLRARYSAATAKKIATNDWVIIGDLSA